MSMSPSSIEDFLFFNLINFYSFDYVFYMGFSVFRVVYSVRGGVDVSLSTSVSNLRSMTYRIRSALGIDSRFFMSSLSP
jgi:hypothetical protein